MYGNSLHIALSIYCGVLHFKECYVILSSLRVLLVEYLYLNLKLTLLAINFTPLSHRNNAISITCFDKYPYRFDIAV